ncbi:single-stranded DNA-binding protein [Hydrogenimonas sp.]|nr:single-stranded DNA-binding protein [Hydrogenimonas sp.]
MFNKVILIGNLTRDVELRYLPSGQALAKCGIATNRRYKDSSGMQKDETMFIDFTVWGRSAEVANQYLHKGSRVLLEGRLTLEQWTDQSGQKRSRHSITVENLKMLDRKGENEAPAAGGYTEPPQQSGQPSQAAYSAPQKQQPQELPTIDIDEDDIPF